ncbi:MAG: ABC transporter ATP-binding protein [Clostridia bacterium]|nr:ABC transporter ATP-binding protein [Clostridia bacterium]MBR5753750.1 ABC transporter ATP-binding protein [Clostridia bacterium]
MTPLFELSNVCFAYEGHIALRYITLDIAPGETVVFQGPNGCGKSTLMKLLNGLVFPEEGTYRFDGDEISEKTLKDTTFSKRFHQRVGFIFQNADVQLFCANVEEEISFGPRQMGLSEEEIRQRTDDVIALLDIEKLRERAPYHLSGGEKRKVAIACILSMNPEALVLDEPLAGLDRKTQEWLVGFLLQMKAAGKTLVISTHNDELAHTLADRIVTIDEDHTVVKIETNERL